MPLVPSARSTRATDRDLSRPTRRKLIGSSVLLPPVMASRSPGSCGPSHPSFDISGPCNPPKVRLLQQALQILVPREIVPRDLRQACRPFPASGHGQDIVPVTLAPPRKDQ